MTKDVPPYAIVGGNPAKVIRYRFDEDDRRGPARCANGGTCRATRSPRLIPLLQSDRVRELVAAVKVLRAQSS